MAFSRSNENTACRRSERTSHILYIWYKATNPQVA